jgi:hypothetical protein
MNTLTRNITTGEVEIYVTQDSVQFVLDTFYEANKDQLHFESVIPLDIEGLNIHAEFLVVLKAPSGPVITLAPVNDEVVIRERAARKRFPLKPAGSYPTATGDTNVLLSLNNIEFSVYKYKNGTKGDLIQSLIVNANLVGFICISNGIIKVTGIDGNITVGANQPQPDVIASILVQALAGVLAEKFDNMPIPQMQEVLGAFPVLNRVTIENKKIICKVAVDTTYAQPIVGNKFAEAEYRTNVGGQAEIIGSSGALIVNELSQAFIRLPEYSRQTTSESGGFGIQLGVFAGVRTPTIQIQNGVITAFSEAGAYASLAVEVCGKWAEMRLSAGTIQVKVNVALHVSDDKKTGYLTFEPDINSIHFAFGLDLPIPFNYVLTPVTALLDLLVSEIAKTIVESYKGFKIDLLTLSEPLDIFGVMLDMKIEKFAPDGDKIAFLGVARV